MDSSRLKELKRINRDSVVLARWQHDSRRRFESSGGFEFRWL